MDDRCDLSVFIFIEYLEWLEALKILKPTMSCSMKCRSVFSSFVSIDVCWLVVTEVFLL